MIIRIILTYLMKKTMIIKYKRVTFIVFVELLHFESNDDYKV